MAGTQHRVTVAFDLPANGAYRSAQRVPDRLQRRSVGLPLPAVTVTGADGLFEAAHFTTRGCDG
ncbi:hypothetical protein AB4Y87_25445 [Paenarthrobacter sp. RAF54_2]